MSAVDLRSFLFGDDSFGFGWYRSGFGGGCVH